MGSPRHIVENCSYMICHTLPYIFKSSTKSGSNDPSTEPYGILDLTWKLTEETLRTFIFNIRPVKKSEIVFYF